MFGKINKVIRVLIMSDIFLNFSWGLLAPVFAIFIVQNIATGSPEEGAKIAGFASLIYWVVKSILQLPIGKYLDKNHGENDDFWFMVLGMFLASVVPFGYLVSSTAWHIYILQVIQAVGMAMVFPPWLAIFTRHIDKGKEAFEWGLNSTTLGFSAGIAGAIGGILVAVVGFNIIFILVGILNIVSSCVLLLMRKEIRPKDHFPYQFPPYPSPF
ncbi:MAG: hypothetical protein COU98_02040 [Candidatus Staskawiczbacteria bacterium CG10_big_fil_rev_8_21_14_0_10_38_10]|uniref:Major facilitator superfamily (MFS) profile domain-containing protein n=1 Tax=Candidatus Staskawiczbacteria bacterium CG10_big_fil_rev_8_21_14_0_10_38_10 TaxID=1974891 RepID=A0A2H9T1A5_9BACT|nr:MAG: hypothetical protein COU98_02040 [Candidatus Staskawiczbacteria bacterium CG10_big_fil_rev_8_21_14_0_10_38_10]